MESDRFDALTRLLSSRRSTLGGLLGGTLALLGLTQPEEVSAARCPKGKKPCRKGCIPRARCCTNADCQTRTTGRVCRQGRCQCPPGRTLCGGRCRNLQSDATNCGACGVVCIGGRICQNRACVCPPGQEDSGGVCGIRPSCRGRGAPDCYWNPSECCSGICPNFTTCAAGAAGRQCYTASDCISQKCIGFVCQA